MKKPSVKRFAKLVKLGTGAAVAAAVLVAGVRGSASLRESAVLENIPNSDIQITHTEQSSAALTHTDSAVVSYDAPINVNTATAEELQALPGIGETKSAAIVKYREEHGAFADAAELMNVNGIGERIFEQIRDKITTGTETSASSKSSCEEPSAVPNISPTNINTATAEDLQALPGIGEAKSAAIIAYRMDHGAFADITELINVNGIGEAIFERLRDKITV